ncbi:hypothetical protein H9L39_19204 [Fusarium oxysporum f. sp. albedinis]|nr:hypothetical protein H9L39_19204 [Fusarium oxysporum f. sp. albedinis]
MAASRSHGRPCSHSGSGTYQRVAAALHRCDHDPRPSVAANQDKPPETSAQRRLHMSSVVLCRGLRIGRRLLEYFWAGTFAFFTAFWCSKMAILAFYLQIFPLVFRIYRIIIWLVIAYSASGYIVAMALNLFLCWPLQRNWYVDQE